MGSHNSVTPLQCVCTSVRPTLHCSQMQLWLCIDFQFRRIDCKPELIALCFKLCKRRNMSVSLCRLLFLSGWFMGGNRWAHQQYSDHLHHNDEFNRWFPPYWSNLSSVRVSCSTQWWPLLRLECPVPDNIHILHQVCPTSSSNTGVAHTYLLLIYHWLPLSNWIEEAWQNAGKVSRSMTVKARF